LSATPAVAPAASELARAHQDDIAGHDGCGRSLRGDRGLEVLLGDREAIRELAAADRAADVEQHAARHDPVRHALDSGDGVAGAGDTGASC